MYKFPDPKTKDPKERRIQRALEMVHGSLAWTAFFLIFFLSFLLPVWAAVFIIIFDVYWIFRIIFITYYSFKANWQLREGKRTDWWERCQNTLHPENFIGEIEKRIVKIENFRREIPLMEWRKKLAATFYLKRTKKILEDTKRLIPVKSEIMDWREIIHVVLLPTANEPAEIIEPAIQSLADSNFPKSQMIVLLATEEREDPENRIPKVEYLKNKFQGVFKDFLVTEHIVATGEMKCKASNATFAAKELMKYLDARNIDYKRVIFSNFDCDSVAHPEYFAALTYAYITNPKRLQRAYQPMPMYHNNIWDTNAFVRLIVTGSSFWHLFQSTRREMVTFSSHSEPFDTLVKVGFWPVNMISEDSVIYWKCLAHFDGDYEVQPIRLPVSLDAVLAETYWKTIKNQYKQKRRWAYGIENFPVTMRALWPNKKVPVIKKLRISFELIEGHFSWATTSFILAFLGWMPLALGGDAFRTSVLAHNLPLFTQNLMNIALLGLLASIPVSMLSLPPKPRKYHWSKYIVIFFQYAISPLVAFLSALPAVDSQTRMLLGRYFGEFWVTEKMRKK
ncbi:MAG TPA: hypothetical protein DIT25_00975 [Candidatus Moranbacteria bacterium]|nr:hypothetical protein [Candidatus Moranbacteria bacterium]